MQVESERGRSCMLVHRGSPCEVMHGKRACRMSLGSEPSLGLEEEAEVTLQERGEVGLKPVPVASRTCTLKTNREAIT